MPNCRDGDVQLITYLPRELRREFKWIALAREESMSKILRDAIVRMVGEAQRAEGGSRG
jgi:hypothetical protein